MIDLLLQPLDAGGRPHGESARARPGAPAVLAFAEQISGAGLWQIFEPRVGIVSATGGQKKTPE